MSTSPHSSQAERQDRRPFQVHLPGFLPDGAEIGLGDVVKRITGALGIRPCGGCLRRAEALNRWMVLSGRRR